MATSTELEPATGCGESLPFCKTQDEKGQTIAVESKRRSSATIINEQTRKTSKFLKINKKTDLTQLGFGNSKKLSLKDLQIKRPPGYKRFQAAVDWSNLDEETALQLWLDIFKPLSSFEMLGIACE